MNHGELLRQVLLYLHTHHHGRWWKNETGALKAESGHFQRYGLVGSSDIIGFTNQGIATFVEIKVGKDKLSKQQIAFKEITQLNGCIHIVVHDSIVPSAFKQIPKKE